MATRRTGVVTSAATSSLSTSTPSGGASSPTTARTSSWTAAVAAVRRTRTTTLAMNPSITSGCRTAISASGTGTATQPAGTRRRKTGGGGNNADGYCSTTPGSPRSSSACHAGTRGRLTRRRPPRLRGLRRGLVGEPRRCRVGQGDEILTVVVDTPAGSSAVAMPSLRRTGSTAGSVVEQLLDRRWFGHGPLRHHGSGRATWIELGGAALGEEPPTLRPGDPCAARQGHADDVAVVVGVRLQQHRQPVLAHLRDGARVLAPGDGVVDGADHGERVLPGEAEDLHEGRVGFGVAQLAEVVDDHERRAARSGRRRRRCAPAGGHRPSAPWATLPQNGAWASGVGRTWTWNSGMPASAADWAMLASAVVLPLRGGPVTSTWP